MRKPKVANPSDPVLWCKEAAEKMEAGDNKGAIYCYQESLKLRPEVSDVWFNVGLLFEKSGDKNAALGCYLTASKMFPSDFRFPAERARMLAEMKHFAEAAEVISEAVTINPHSPLLLSNKAAYLIFSQEPAEALEAAEAALSIDPSYTAAFLHKAHALLLLGNGDEARAALDEADNSDPRVLKMKANISLRLQNFEAGLSAAQKLIEMTPEDDEAWSLLGSAFAYSGDSEGAVRAFQQAMKLNPKEKSYKANLVAVKGMK